MYKMSAERHFLLCVSVHKNTRRLREPRQSSYTEQFLEKSNSLYVVSKKFLDLLLKRSVVVALTIHLFHTSHSSAKPDFAQP